MVVSLKNPPYFCAVKNDNGAIAQLVEHRTENPCVPGSNPGGTTAKEDNRKVVLFFVSTKVGLPGATTTFRIKIHAPRALEPQKMPAGGPNSGDCPTEIGTSPRIFGL